MTPWLVLEEWKLIEGYGSRYAISSEGRVWSFYSNKYLRPGIASNGYPTVALGRGNTRTVHSLVADAFLGPCPKGQLVRHADDVRTNPRLSNLSYGTPTQNIEDAIANGGWHSEKRKAAWKAKEILTDNQRKEIQELLPNNSLRAIGRYLGVTHGTIARVVKGGELCNLG